MKDFSPINKINHPLFTKHGISVSIKRDDLIHPIISGNKWRKLKCNLIETRQGNYTGVLSFGGSFSNHIHALAYACFQQKIPCVGIIRGEAENASNFTLTCARQWGMQLHFVDRKTYRRRHEPEFHQELLQSYPGYFIVPEGGSNQLALPGMADVIDELNQQASFDTLITPVGSGGTLAGLINADNNQHKLLGIAVLKQQGYLNEAVNDLLGDKAEGFSNWQILNQFHRGGYAKFNVEDVQRLQAFKHHCAIPFEPVYSGKMILALLDLVESGYFPAGHRIMLLHTGGLQGLGGLTERGLLDSKEWPMPQTDLSGKL
ncbi:1-aminocyclopropane-1-carboxylate deaminase/D-cysteine desulfhydrase [Thalassotalea sp. PLHSN55]|uniref:1-aminocyclopropane-1-carboxylate deaminase/D-cysteine desulfhydrase n=1 Tax=Thalassotalea sp. PLHSN55 TaxID=3435888 RepID=UPI003F8753B7